MMSRPRRIAFQGEPGANSHIACRDVYPDHEAIACTSFEDAFQAVSGGSAALGMIPIENSVAGRVADIHHILPQSGLHIVGEYFLPVHYCLVAPEGASMKTVKHVRSHPQALGQCRAYLRGHCFTPEIGADTAGSARQVAEMGDASYAALAPRLAAEVYGLDILDENVEDEEHNTTRFVVLSKEEGWAARGLGPLVTAFVFRVRNVPAALYKAMGGFATNGVNMTKLESYQLDGAFFATQFYSDIEGHPEDAHVARALEELAFFSKELRILGVYRASPFREQAAARAAARAEEDA